MLPMNFFGRIGADFVDTDLRIRRAGLKRWLRAELENGKL
jgi:hypothetical protein